MTVTELVKDLNLKVIAGEQGLDKIVRGGYACDLLSWVMSKAEAGNVWITVQININIIAVAVLTEISCIIIPENIEISPDTIERADREGIPLLSSCDNCFDIVRKISSLKGFDIE